MNTMPMFKRITTAIAMVMVMVSCLMVNVDDVLAMFTLNTTIMLKMIRTSVLVMMMLMLSSLMYVCMQVRCMHLLQGLGSKVVLVLSSLAEDPTILRVLRAILQPRDLACLCHAAALAATAADLDGGLLPSWIYSIIFW